MKIKKGDIIRYSINRVTRHPNEEPSTFTSKNYEEKVYLKIVGITNSYGPDLIYTSRQEANALVFDRGIGRPDVHQQYDWEVNTTDPNIQNTDNDRSPNSTTTETYYTPPLNSKYFSSTTPPPTYADGLGYFNSILQQRMNNTDLDGILMSSTSTFNFTQGLLFGFSIRDIISGNSIKSGVDNYTFLVSVITYTLLSILLIIGLIMFLITGKIIISSNKKIFATLKVLGYTNPRIMIQSLSVYFIFGFFIAVVVTLPLFNIVTNLYTTSIQNFFGAKSLVIPPVHINGMFILIYLGILFTLYVMFWFYSYFEIKKVDAKTLLGEN